MNPDQLYKYLTKLPELPGQPPSAPNWGQFLVWPSPELSKRIPKQMSLTHKVAVVIGAGGSFGPDLINALFQAGHKYVIGADIQLTYLAPGAVYRYLDLRDEGAVQDFYAKLRAWLHKNQLELAATYDLSAIQVCPNRIIRRDWEQLIEAKNNLVSAICAGSGDQKLFYMSSAEVYGRPINRLQPLQEHQLTRPFNRYAKAKAKEEEFMMFCHRRPTLSGKLQVTALRTFAISMVNYDLKGRIISARNYSGPKIIAAAKLVRNDIIPPVVNRDFKCQIHASEEVAEVCIHLGSAETKSKTWGRVFNCPAKPITHGQLVSVGYNYFKNKEKKMALHFRLLRFLINDRSLPRFGIWLIGYTCQSLGQLIGLRGVGERLPYVCQSFYMDYTEIKEALGDKLSNPEGTDSAEAIRKLAEGVSAGGNEDILFKRYSKY